MTIGAIGASALFSLNLRPNAPQLSASAWSQAQARPANSAAPAATILPLGAALPLSLETVINLQAIEEPKAVERKAPSAADLFLEEARKSPIERMREQILEELGLTEESLAQMSPEERRATEDKISDMIEEKTRKAMGADGEAPSTNAEMIEAVA